MWLVKAIAVWALMMLAETLHGILRVRLIVPRTGDIRSRQIGVFTGTAIIYLIAWLCDGWMAPPADAHRLAVGCVWAALTVAFEVALGRAVFHYKWKRIAADFDLPRGGLLPIGLLLMALAPFLIGRLA